MCAVYAAWGLFGIVAVPFGPLAWFAFSGLLLLFMVSTRVPQVVKSRSASAFFTFGVPLLGVCVGVTAATALVVTDPAIWTGPPELQHDIQIGWVSDENQTALFDTRENHHEIYAWSLVDWSIDDRYVYGFADDPKDANIGGYVGRPLGRFYLVLEWDTLKFYQFVRWEDAPPLFREKLASLQTDPRHRKQGPFIR